MKLNKHKKQIVLHPIDDRECIAYFQQLQDITHERIKYTRLLDKLNKKSSAICDLAFSIVEDFLDDNAPEFKQNLEFEPLTNTIKINECDGSCGCNDDKKDELGIPIAIKRAMEEIAKKHGAELVMYSEPPKEQKKHGGIMFGGINLTGNN